MVFGLIWRRLIQLVPVVLGVTFFAFVILNLLPGGSAYAILGIDATKAAVANLTRQLGLNEPLPVRYWQWLWPALHGNLGSGLYTHLEVTSLLAQRAPVTAELGLFAIIIALAFAVPVAIFSAHRANRTFDKVATAVSLVGVSTPPFVIGLVLVVIFAVKLHWLPASGFEPVSKGLFENLRSLLLPALSLSALLFATYMRILRGDMINQLATEHYVETARGKGLSEWRILLRHVLPNSLFGMITVLTVNLGLLIGGSVIIETVFAVPGVGNAFITAIEDHDQTTVLGVVVCLALTIVMANLLADILYTLLDPRVRVRHGR